MKHAYLLSFLLIATFSFSQEDQILKSQQNAVIGLLLNRRDYEGFFAINISASSASLRGINRFN